MTRISLPLVIGCVIAAGGCASSQTDRHAAPYALLIPGGETAPDPLLELRASGGGTNSPLWRQIIADVLGAPLALTRTAEGVATGGAILAAVAAKDFGSSGAPQLPCP